MTSRPWFLLAILLTFSAAMSQRALAQSDAASRPVSSGPPPSTTLAEPATSAPPAAPPAVLPSGSTTTNPSAVAVTTTEAQQALDVLQNEDKRRELVQTLQTIVKLGPVLPPIVKKTVPVHATAAVAVPAAAPKPAPVAHLAPHSLGADILTEVSSLFSDIGAETSKTAAALTRFSSISVWVHDNLDDPESRANLLTGTAKLVLVVVCGFAAEWILRYLLRRPLAALRTLTAQRSVEEDDNLSDDDEATSPAKINSWSASHRHTTGAWRLLRRLPFIIAAMLLDFLPVAAFVATAYLVASTNAFSASGSATAAILAIVNAYTLLRLLMCIVGGLISPASSHLRLINVKTGTAIYLDRWMWRILTVAIFGSAITEIAGFYGLEQTAHDALLKMVALVVHIFLVIIVVQCRRRVAGLIAAGPGATGTVAIVRNGLAATWHYIAIFYIVALWVVWAIEVKNGMSRLVHLFFSTIAVLVAARLISILALGLLERVLRGGAGIVNKVPGFDARAERYHRLLRDVIWAVISVAATVTLLEVWGINAVSWFSKSQIGGRLLGAAVTISIAVAVAIVCWEILTGSLERHLVRLGEEGQTARAVRLRTLTPMLRTTLMVTLIVVLGMTILSEIGVNIAPLLAGAGIVGVAVGFGSQKLVQDLITGIFLLLENAMQVGDQVSVGGLSGAVEHLSIRTIRLRAGDGSVHIIPFSSVTTVTNTNRGVGNAAVSVTVDYAEDTDRVGEVLKQIAAEMRSDEPFKSMMTSDLALWGVDKVDASTVTIVGQIACTDSGRWGVQREFNRRMKLRFQELGISIGNPTQTIFLRKALDDEQPIPKIGASPASANAEIDEQSPTNVPESPPPSALSNKE